MSLQAGALLPDGDGYDALVLADDGTMWALVVPVPNNPKWIELPPLPQREEPQYVPY